MRRQGRRSATIRSGGLIGLSGLLIGAGLLVATGWTAASAGERPATRASDGPPTMEQPVALPAIYVEIATASWRRHQMAAVPLEPSIRVKLKDAGLTAVHERGDPHDLVLRVDYREARGRAVGIGEWDTTITCDIILEHVQRGPFGQWSIQAAPQQSEAFPVTYIDTQYEFQSHPYFFFLGELVRRAAEQRPDTVDALTQGLTKVLRERVSSFGELSPANENPHGIAPNEMPYVPMAIQKTIQELGKLRDERALPVLVSLAKGSDVRFRVEAMQALGTLGAEGGRPVLEAAAGQDQDTEVRRAAVEALGRLGAASRRP